MKTEKISSLKTNVLCTLYGLHPMPVTNRILLLLVLCGSGWNNKFGLQFGLKNLVQMVKGWWYVDCSGKPCSRGHTKLLRQCTVNITRGPLCTPSTHLLRTAGVLGSLPKKQLRKLPYPSKYHLFRQAQLPLLTAPTLTVSP